MNKITTGLFALAATTLLAGNAHAQVPNATPFAIEARGGLALPQGDTKDGLDNGFTFGGNLSYNVLPSLAVYAGYTRSSFGFSEDSGESDDVNFIDQGFDGGVRLSIPTPIVPIDPFVKAGLIYHQVTLDGDGGSISLDHELGFEVGAGLGINILPKLQLTPAVTYSQYSVDLDDDNGEEVSGDVKNVRVDIGLRLRI